MISQKHIDDYHRKGYFVLERAIDEEQLHLLRAECERFIGRIEAEMDAQGVEKLGLNHRGKRYFIANRQSESPALQRFLFGDLMAEIVRATIGEPAYLFVEQFVVKAAERGMAFSWHQDGGYIAHEHRPYVSCWCTLDDVDEENGTVYLLPYDRAGTRDYVEHVRDEATNDMVGYHGDDPGEPVVAPAGSVAVFSSTTLHRSGENTASQRRRIYLAQYSPEVIMNPEGTAPHRQSVPFLPR